MLKPVFIARLSKLLLIVSMLLVLAMLLKGDDMPILPIIQTGGLGFFALNFLSNVLADEPEENLVNFINRRKQVKASSRDIAKELIESGWEKKQIQKVYTHMLMTKHLWLLRLIVVLAMVGILAYGIGAVIILLS